MKALELQKNLFRNEICRDEKLWQRKWNLSIKILVYSIKSSLKQTERSGNCNFCSFNYIFVSQCRIFALYIFLINKNVLMNIRRHHDVAPPYCVNSIFCLTFYQLLERNVLPVPTSYRQKVYEIWIFQLSLVAFRRKGSQQGIKLKILDGRRQHTERISNMGSWGNMYAIIVENRVK